MVRRYTSTLAGVTLLLFALAAAAIEPVNSTAFTGKAIRGYDPVAYFKEARPVEGLKQYTHEWRGATWYFSTAANRDAFAADPAKWAPQYGGWCAYAMASGRTVSIDPEAFEVYRGKLYLNYSPRIQRDWLADKDNYIAQADKHYQRLVGEKR